MAAPRRVSPPFSARRRAPPLQPFCFQTIDPTIHRHVRPVPAARIEGKQERRMWKEFRDFAMKGNVVDLAIGVIIGAAFGKIVESLVGDMFMPMLGAVTGGLDFTNYFIPLSPRVSADSLAEARKQGAVLAYGSFMTIAINFLVIAGALFVAVKGINYLKREEAAKPAEPSKQEALLAEIRDLLKQR
jgi:large conductance mechanosensitive channel